MSEINVNHSEWLCKRAENLRAIIPPDSVYLHLALLIDVWYNKDSILHDYDRCGYLQTITADENLMNVSLWVAQTHDELDAEEESE